MSDKPRELLAAQIANQIEALERMIREAEGTKTIAKECGKMLADMDGAKEDVLKFTVVAQWCDVQIQALASALESAKKIQNGDTSHG